MGGKPEVGGKNPLLSPQRVCTSESLEPEPQEPVSLLVVGFTAPLCLVGDQQGTERNKALPFSL